MGRGEVGEGNVLASAAVQYVGRLIACLENVIPFVGLEFILACSAVEEIVASPAEQPVIATDPSGVTKEQIIASLADYRVVVRSAL